MKLLPRPHEGTGRSGETLMETISTNQSIEYEGAIYKAAHEHYRKNMGSILRKATKRKVAVLFSEVVANIRDLEPFIVVDSDHHQAADIVFFEARQLELKGDFEKARELYYSAKDLDGLRFRASEDINLVIKELANEYHSILVPMKAVFEENSPGNLIGNNLMTEHVHPNIDGYFLMADAFYNSIITSEIIGKPDATNLRSSSHYRKNWGFTPLDSVFTQMRLQQLLTRWPFVKTNPDKSYLEQFIPTNQLDSMAMNILLGEISISDAYRQMAGHFENEFKHYDAYQYTLALARMNPHNPVNFVKAGNLMMMENNYELAIEMYLQAVRYNKQPNLFYKIGELYLRLGNREKGAQFLADAKQMSTGEVKVWLGQLLTEIETGTNRFNTTSSDNDLMASDKAVQQRVVIFAPTEVINRITEARVLMRQQNYPKALQLLKEANEIHETAAANRYIGEILLNNDDRDALLYLRKAYPEHSNNANFLSTFCYAALVFHEIGLARKMLERIKILDPGNQRISMLESNMVETTQGSK